KLLNTAGISLRVIVIASEHKEVSAFFSAFVFWKMFWFQSIKDEKIGEFVFVRDAIEILLSKLTNINPLVVRTLEKVLTNHPSIRAKKRPSCEGQFLIDSFI